MDRTGVDGLILEVFEEIKVARDLHPQWPRDMIHASAIVAEECGELTRACLQAAYEHGDLYAVRKEAMHTAAMALRFLLNFDVMYSPESAQLQDTPSS